ncbi:serine hydrolase domain-containing protein [Nocardia sp. CA-107356]|uniref:serine hydrolase domain-containing protein n=1 Tax=Nocardia sp. CA-107356 TaxID=3239972 RepID=UPI003D8CACA9
MVEYPRRACVLVISLLLVLLPYSGAAVAAPVGIDPAAVDRYMSEYLSRTRLPGASIAITHGDQVVYVAGYGHDSTGSAITATTRMPIASVSKSMTAMAVMQLVDAGRMRLDAPVRQYLTDFRLADPRADRITVRQLLNQTSGMSDTAFPDLRRPQADSLAGAVERLRTAELAADPGTRFNYHNPNYQVAARLVEVVSGEPFAAYLQRNVFGPIGMRDSSTVDTARAAEEVTHGYIRAYGFAIPMAEPDWFVGGSHGVITTAADMAGWLITQNNGGLAPDGHRVVSAAAMADMHTPSGVADDDYGMGWRREQSDHGVQISHNGDWFTYTAEQVLLPDTGYGIAVIADTGMSLEDDPGIIAQGLVELTQGETPDVHRPWGIWADWGMALLTLGTLGLGVLCLVRSRRWADQQGTRPAWLIALRQLPYLAPIVILAVLPQLAGLVFRGRAATFLQVTYVWPALVVFLGIAALAGVSVLLARGVWFIMLRRNRSGADAQREEPAAQAPA